MRDREGVAFLQWALPRLRLRWPGFRKVRRQVLRRLDRRLDELGLSSLDAYRARLAADPAEWAVLARLCRVTISRFHRDRGPWETLRDRVLPELAARTAAVGQSTLGCWSAGCASGEEPYTLALVWRFALAARFPGVEPLIVATDTDSTVLARARAAVYPPGCLRELPAVWREAAFAPAGEDLRLKDGYVGPVRLVRHDLRDGPALRPGGGRLILCRNLAFTYFADDLQREVLAGFAGVLPAGGVLVVGAHETLPAGATAFAPGPGAGIWRRR